MWFSLWFLFCRGNSKSSLWRWSIGIRSAADKRHSFHGTKPWKGTACSGDTGANENRSRTSKGKISQDRGRKLYCYLHEKRNDPWKCQKIRNCVWHIWIVLFLSKEGRSYNIWHSVGPVSHFKAWFREIGTTNSGIVHHTSWCRGLRARERCREIRCSKTSRGGSRRSLYWLQRRNLPWQTQRTE